MGTNPLISFASCELTQRCFPHYKCYHATHMASLFESIKQKQKNDRYTWQVLQSSNVTLEWWEWKNTALLRMPSVCFASTGTNLVFPSALLPLNKCQNMLKYAKCLPKTVSTEELHLRAQRADWCARASGGAAAAAHWALQKHSKPQSSWKSCHLGLLHKTKM